MEHETAVEQIQSLEWRIGAWASGHHLVPAWAIESAEHGVLLLSDPGEVDHAAEFWGAEGFFGEIAIHIVFLDLLEMETGAAHATVERSGSGEHAIADGLSFKSTWWEAPEPSGIGVSGEVVGTGGGRLPEGMGEEQEALDVFDGPSALDEFGRQPI